MEVIGGLNAKDDVDWAAAGANDGLEEVEMAIAKFERLVLIYISTVEEVQQRPDVDDMSKVEMTILLDNLDEVVTAWDNVNKSLKEVKRQVGLAQEWESCGTSCWARSVKRWRVSRHSCLNSRPRDTRPSRTRQTRMHLSALI